ncbi:MAG: hypothetical protein ABJC05_07875 [Pyrinomonadaceae bacterium]
MLENDRTDKPIGEEGTPELSPDEKLEERPDDSLIPGAQNPASKEIKKEINPNTE